MASNAQNLRRIVGKKIVKVRLNPFSDGRPGRDLAYDPEIYLSDGSVIRFSVQETEVGEYGIKPILHIAKNKAV